MLDQPLAIWVQPTAIKSNWNKGKKFANRKRPKPYTHESLVGKKFGRLVVLKRDGVKGTAATWLCRCDCGGLKVTITLRLKNGQCRSCGCIQAENCGNMFRTHGRSGCNEHKLWKDAKKRSREFNTDFNITMEDIIIPEFCPILGIKLFSTPRRPTNNTPSLDRINPKLGYIKGNIRVISVQANRMKQDSTIEELYKIIDYMKGVI